MPCLVLFLLGSGLGVVRQVILDLRLRSNMNSGQANSKQSEQSNVRHGTGVSTSVLCWQDEGMRVLAQYRNCHYHRSAGLHSPTHAKE